MTPNTRQRQEPYLALSQAREQGNSFRVLCGPGNGRTQHNTTQHTQTHRKISAFPEHRRPRPRLSFSRHDEATAGDEARVRAIELVAFEEAGGSAVAPMLRNLARRVAQRRRLHRAVALDIAAARRQRQRFGARARRGARRGATQRRPSVAGREATPVQEIATMRDRSAFSTTVKVHSEGTHA